MTLPLGIEDDTLARLIQAAREFHAKEEVVFPDSSPDTSDDDWAMQVLADHAGDLTLRELEDTLSGLGPEYQAELQALSAVGRGDYAVEEWEGALEDARDDWSPDTAHRLIANPMIADEWEAGLEQMQAADR
ncbi:conserved hypothetical protein [Thioalkalivibrio sp. K90mix]|jgi:hypothetical protein|uniref:DUF3775 domain-containing protein n=1 Tax=unclassified Thioalkalivibrio TaxID=2621013 RepID=UPI000195AB5E|nr:MULTISPECIES: DUF3775 domain-containing protein [unclassified Thioalkalivibrio]ADC70754.1 conserved hypothetical protein [Thioalkalivibrio sp. K90mix]